MTYEKEVRKREEAITCKDEIDIKRGTLKTQLMLKTKELENLEETVKAQAKEIESKSRERALLAKDVVSALD